MLAKKNFVFVSKFSLYREIFFLTLTNVWLSWKTVNEEWRNGERWTENSLQNASVNVSGIGSENILVNSVENVSGNDFRVLKLFLLQ